LHAKTVIQTILGRRYLKDINSQNAMVRGGAERNAVNALYKEVLLTLLK
jgi:DNA polymerase I-like protein with 3'-5' exonuclease and polymerase domains